MKIALVYPEIYDVAKYGKERKEFPPFGILYLASVIEKRNIDVDIIIINKENCIKDFTKYNFIGFSIPSSIVYPIIKECRFKSTFQKNTLLVAGGVHASFFPSETLFDLKVEVVGVGEGENTIIEIIDEYKTKNFSKIQGICYLKNSKAFFTPIRKLIKNLDNIPLPARHLIPQEDIIMNNRLSDLNIKMTHIMFSRGCPFTCNFCASAQKLLQLRSGENVRNELIHLKNTYSIEGFSLVDDNNIINKKNIFEICDAIKDLNLKWNSLSRVDVIDKDKLIKMQEAGCIEIIYGVESASEKILKAMNKNITRKQIFKAIAMAYSINMKVKIFLIHGFPSENMETTNETIEFLKKVTHMIDRVSLFRFVPLPGSYIFNNAEKFDLKINYTDYETHDWEQYHIHHNYQHWWGTKNDFDIVNKSYIKLEKFVNTHWK